jgi:hypothetical protein
MVLAAALVSLGRLCRVDPALPRKLALVAYLEAALLVGIALAEVLHLGDEYDYLSLVTGAIVGPLLAFSLARNLGRPPATVTTATAPPR